MRKLLFLPFILFTLPVLGQQQTDFTPTPPIFVVAQQMGIDTIRNGVDTVKLTQATITEMNEVAADTDYDVTLTPKGNCGMLSLFKLNRYYFIVKQQMGPTTKGAFDYIVFTKQPRPWMPLQPPHPPAGH